MGTEATSVCAVSIADNGSPCSVRVEQGTNGDTTVIEGVRDFAEVPIHDIAGTYAAEHHTHRFSGNPLHTEHPSKDMHDTVRTSASKGNSDRELGNTQGIDKKQGAFDKEETSPVKQPVARDEVDGVKSPQIRQFSWGETVGKSMLVPVTVGKHRVFAVVDTAAQVSLISSDVWEELEMEMECIPEVVQLANAQRDSVMDGRLYTHVGFLLGGQKYYSDFVVADISDGMILGMDFLKKHKCKIDLEDDSLEIEKRDKVFAVMKGDTEQRYHVSRVTLTKKTKIPPHSMQFVSVKVQNPAPVTYAVEPTQKASLFSPSMVVQGDDQMTFAILNMSGHHVTLRRNEEVGRATEINAMMVSREEQEGEVEADLYVYGEQSEEPKLQVCRVKTIVNGIPEVELEEGKVPGEMQQEMGQGGKEDDFSSSERGGALEFAGASPEKSSEDVRAGVSDDLDQVKVCDGEEGEPGGLCSIGQKTGGGDGPVQQDEVERGSESRSCSEGETLKGSTVEGSEKLPEYMRTLYEKSCRNLTSAQAKKVLQVLLKFLEVFAAMDLDIGRFTALVHYIRTGSAFPIKQGMRRSPLGFEQEEKKTIDSMLDAGVIEPSQSEWASPPVLVRKKDGSWRYCIDFRAVNNATIKDAYPLPLIEECIDSLAGKKWFCTLDMNAGYWQIPVADEDKDKTAFITRYGLFQFTRMPFRLSNSPATFQRVMHLVLSGLIWSVVIVYLDDINIMGATFEETLQNLEIVLARFKKFGLKLKPRKCALFQTEVKFLGRLATQEGIEVTKEHVQAVQDWPRPQNRKALQQFLGFLNYHRGFIQGLAGISAPLYDLTRPRAEWKWADEHTEAFETLKRIMTSPPVLAYPNAKDQFILDTDASDLAIGAVLSQVQDGKERPISFASKALNSKQKQYCTTRKELLAVVAFTQHYEHYLLGRPFLIRTDHASLAWLMRFKKIGGQLCRWLEYLSRFAYTIQHRSGDKHSNADGLSRVLQDATCDCYEAGRELDTLPCQGCKYCQKMANDWERFETLVDDVVPLSVSRDLTAESEQRVPSQEKIQNCEEEEESISAVLMGSCESPVVRVIQLEDRESQTSPVLQQYSPEELSQLQQNDADLKPILGWLDSGETPEDSEVLLQSPATRHLWLCRSQLRLVQGVLHYQWEEKNKVSQLLVVPQELKEEVLQHCHDSKFGGHFGRDKTLAALRRRFLWRGMATDVDVYVKTCRECHLGKPQNRRPKAPLQNYQAGFPGDRVHLDILGPFCESAQGNRYVLMIVDQFSRWVEMVPLRIQDAQTVARSFFETYVVRFGVPFVVHTDQGRNFDCSVMKSFCQLMDITKTRTTPYRPSSNGQVERYNTIVLNFLRCFLRGKQREWDQYLPVLGMNIRSMVNRSTGFTPNMLQLGHEVNLPVDVIYGLPVVRKFFETAAGYLKVLLAQFRQVHVEARANLRGAQKHQKRLYDVTCRRQTFDVGDLVYRKNSSVKLGQSRKLCPLFTGPYVVTRVLSPYLFEVQGQKKSLVLHHDRLRLCEDRVIPFWVRRKRRQLFEQEERDSGVEDVAQDEESDEPAGPDEGEHEEQLPDVRGSSDLDATLPYGLEEERGHVRTEDTGSVGLDAAVGSGTEDVVAVDRAAEEESGTGSEDDQRYDMKDRVEDHPWMEEESWGLQHLFPDAGRTTRHGRRVRTPGYLRDYVGNH